MLVHLLDVGSEALAARELLGRYDAIRDELRAYQPALLERAESSTAIPFRPSSLIGIIR